MGVSLHKVSGKHGNVHNSSEFTWNDRRSFKMGGLLPGKENLLTPQLSSRFIVDVFDGLREDCVHP